MTWAWPRAMVRPRPCPWPRSAASVRKRWGPWARSSGEKPGPWSRTTTAVPSTVTSAGTAPVGRPAHRMGRVLAGPVIGTITVASLPEPFRRRAAQPEIPGAQTLMQSVYVAVGLARFLPDNRLRAEGLTSLLHLSSDNDVPQAATPTALRRRMTQVGALFRLVTPFAARHGPTERTGRSGALTNSSPRCWTRPATATWTGPILAAMARELSSGRTGGDQAPPRVCRVVEGTPGGPRHRRRRPHQQGGVRRRCPLPRRARADQGRRSALRRHRRGRQAVHRRG